MATNLNDAKITVRLDTDQAEGKLDNLESKLKKDEKAIKDAERKQKRAGGAPGAAGAAAPRGKRGAKGQRGATGKAAGIGKMVGVSAIMSAIPFGGVIDFAASVAEFGSPFQQALVEQIIPDLPAMKGLKGLMAGTGRTGIPNPAHIGDAITWLRSKMEAVQVAKEGAGDIIRASTGLGEPIDGAFLVDHTVKLFEIADVQAKMRATIKKAQMRNMGKALGSTFRKFYGF